LTVYLFIYLCWQTTTKRKLTSFLIFACLRY